MVSRKLIFTAITAVFVAAQALGQTMTDNGSSFAVTPATATNTIWTAPGVAFDTAFTSQWFFRLGTTGAFQSLGTMTLDTGNSGLSGTSVLNLVYNGSGFNVAIRYSLLGGATQSQVSEQVRVTNSNNTSAVFQLLQYNNYDTSSTAGTGDTITRLNSSSMGQTGTGANAVGLVSGATPIPTFSQLGNAFSSLFVGSGFTNLDTAAGSGIGQTVSPNDAAYAFQWNTTISAGGSFQVGTDKILAPVPEPASLAALGLGAMALIRRRRARK